MGKEQGQQSPEEVRTTEILHDYWSDCLSVFGDTPLELIYGDSIYGEIVQMYRLGEGRAYRDIFHAERVIGLINQFGYAEEAKLKLNVPLLQLAAFGRNLVYNHGSETNREESAEAFDGMLEKLGFDMGDRSEVRRLVLLSDNDELDPEDREGQLTVDSDLVIFTSSGREYDKFIASLWIDQVRSGGNTDFNKDWLEYLKELNGRKKIFLNERVRDSYEARARSRIEKEILDRTSRNLGVPQYSFPETPSSSD